MRVLSDNGFTWNDLNDISWYELGSLGITMDDLKLPKLELLKKIQIQDIPVSPSIYEKFKKICECVPDDFTSKISVKNSAKKIVEAIIFIVEALEHTEWVTEHLQEMKEIIDSIINYFS